MNKWKIKYISLSIVLLSFAVLMGACSADKNEKKEATETPVIEEQDDSNELESDEDSLTNDENGEETEVEDVSEDVHVEHQKGLKIGETGTVVSGTIHENDRYEVTLNDIQLLTEVESERNYHEIFIKANVTIKNIEETPLPIESIFRPTVGDEDLEDIELFPEFRKDFFADDKGTPFEGDEIAPGEMVIVDYYFDTVKADYYRFAFGNPSDQIVTFANWKIKTEEM